MATNELPEVRPVVTSMPTSGWHLQTTGSARRRVTKNKGDATQGIYDVAGVPNHTHNSSAFLSVTANYRRYRTRALTIPAGVWADGPLVLPVGMLTDSIEPDNAAERYDRAIERCVGYISMFPENCTGTIREPTRSIGEVRTLVTPKVRTNTLTYVEEVAGWRIPGDHTDKTRDDTAVAAGRSPVSGTPLISEYPDISLDMRPLGAVRPTIDAHNATHAGTCFIESVRFRYRIECLGAGVALQQAVALGDIGTLSDGVTEWDGTIKFKWDSDARRYKSTELSVVLHKVREVTLLNVDTVTAVFENDTKIMVVFPALQTSVAHDGFCWFSALENEEAASYATRARSYALAPKPEVEVIGLTNEGPFTWRGMPAYRIPVGGTYAHPAPPITQEEQFTHWEKSRAFTSAGICNYQLEVDELAYITALIASQGVNNLAGALVLQATANTNVGTTNDTHQLAEVALATKQAEIASAYVTHAADQGTLTASTARLGDATTVKADSANGNAEAQAVYNAAAGQTAGIEQAVVSSQAEVNAKVLEITNKQAEITAMQNTADADPDAEDNSAALATLAAALSQLKLELAPLQLELEGITNARDNHLVDLYGKNILFVEAAARSANAIGVYDALVIEVAGNQQAFDNSATALAARRNEMPAIQTTLGQALAASLQAAGVLGEANLAVEAFTHVGLLGFRQRPPTFHVTDRQYHHSGGIYYKRAAGILQQLTAGDYDVQPDFSRALRLPLADAYNLNITDNDVVTSGLQNISLVPNPDLEIDLTLWQPESVALTKPVGHSLSGSTTFEFNVSLGEVNQTHLPTAPQVADTIVRVAATPLFYEGLLGYRQAAGAAIVRIAGAQAKNLYAIGVRVDDDGGNFVRYDYVPNVYCNVTRATTLGDTARVDVAYDFTNAYVMSGTVQIDDLANFDNPRPYMLVNNQGDNFPVKPAIRTTSFFLHRLDGVKSNFVQGAGTVEPPRQNMRDIYRQVYSFGNRFTIPDGFWDFTASADGSATTLRLADTIFAMADAVPIFFQSTVHHNARRVMYVIEKPPPSELHVLIGAARKWRCRTVGTADYRLKKVDIDDRSALVDVPETELQSLKTSNRALYMYVPGPGFMAQGSGYDAVMVDSQRLGAVFASEKRISQHVCAPILNPNQRIGSVAPLNHDSRHLPPELRDFRLQLHEIDWARLGTDKVTLNELVLYQFRDGNQKQATAQNIMYLPEFREFKVAVDSVEFEIECYSNLGSPSYWCFFCRNADTDILQQPIIKSLSMFCNTTQKKSNSVSDMSVSELYHMTQRNVHPQAEYDRASFNRRQTILLSAEDVGLMGIKAREYQRAKRVTYTFSGTVDSPGNLYILFVYNNRGLHINGRRLATVTLHE